MTALNEFQRLETFGIWHASATEQRRDVIVSLGEATLTISDTRMSALSHWSLPAVERLNPGQRPACFGPGPDVAEVLELDDDTMIEALDKLLGVIASRKAQPRRLRHVLTAAALLALAGLLALWLPGALIRQAVAVVPAAKRAELGEALLDDIRRVAGTPCNGALGRRALDRLHARLLPGRPGRIVVLAQGLALSAHLPGGLILLNRSLIEDHDDPAAAAGHILAEDEAARREDPLKALLGAAGVGASLRLLATGSLARSTLDSYAEHLLAAPPRQPPPTALVPRFAAAGISAVPYARSLADPGGAASDPEAAAQAAALAAADPVPAGQGRPILTDGDWVSLQGICTE